MVRHGCGRGGCGPGFGSQKDMFRDKELMIMAARDIVGTRAVTRRYRRVRVELHGGMRDAGVALGLSLGSSGAPVSQPSSRVPASDHWRMISIPDKRNTEDNAE
jgi:hypothetical protein